MLAGLSASMAKTLVSALKLRFFFLFTAVLYAVDIYTIRESIIGAEASYQSTSVQQSLGDILVTFKH